MACPSMSFLDNVAELASECEVPKPKEAEAGDGSDDGIATILTPSDKLIKQQLKRGGLHRHPL
eukprot:7553123-Lingulodinium_polyedra.AAC.1